MKFGTALAHEDIAGYDDFAAKFFHAQTLGLGIATVAGRARRFFMCHSLLPSYA
jgi:hypothetical protein